MKTLEVLSGVFSLLTNSEELVELVGRDSNNNPRIYTEVPQEVVMPYIRFAIETQVLQLKHERIFTYKVRINSFARKYLDVIKMNYVLSVLFEKDFKSSYNNQEFLLKPFFENNFVLDQKQDMEDGGATYHHALIRVGLHLEDLSLSAV